jgi:hypothetical protein
MKWTCELRCEVHAQFLNLEIYLACSQRTWEYSRVEKWPEIDNNANKIQRVCIWETSQLGCQVGSNFHMKSYRVYRSHLTGMDIFCRFWPTVYIIYYNIAFVNSEHWLTKSRVDITQCQHGKFLSLYFFVLYYKKNIKHFFRIDIQFWSKFNFSVCRLVAREAYHGPVHKTWCSPLALPRRQPVHNETFIDRSIIKRVQYACVSSSRVWILSRQLPSTEGEQNAVDYRGNDGNFLPYSVIFITITVVPIEAFRKMLTSSFPNFKEFLWTIPQQFDKFLKKLLTSCFWPIRLLKNKI